MYTPYLGPNSIYEIFKSIANNIISKWMNFLKIIAKKYDVPILDLNQTFDMYNRSHYGSTEIEPSNSSNQCIAKCISYIYEKYDGYAIYFAKNCDITNLNSVKD